MNRIKVDIESREKWLEMRSKDITSTEVSVLYGLNPYMTLFELWNRKKSGDIVSIEETERMKWGTRLESVIAEGIAADEGWKVMPMKYYMSCPEIKAGSSFDYINDREEILEIKNVDNQVYRDKWIDEGETIEAPPHIELQVQYQMMVSGIKTAWICALVGGNKIIKTKREYNEKIGFSMVNKVQQFWKSIELGVQPEPNFETDAKYIMSMHKYAEPNKIIEANYEIDLLAQEYKQAADEIKKLEDKKDEAKARILMLINDAEKVRGPGFTISAGTVGPAEVSYKREGYRLFKITWKKEK